MVDFQIAFQGGGARLSDLLAAAEVLQAEERAGRIRIRRVAGTSAGAIVAAVIACGGESAKEVRGYVRTHGERLVQMVSGTATGEVKLKSLSNAIKLWQGKPLLNTNGLRKVLTEVLGVALKSGLSASAQDNRDQRRAALSLNFDDIAWMSGKSLFVVAADLIRQSAIVYPEAGNDLIDALVNSAALPFAFRGHAELVANARVDGGLCENLPSDVLLSGTQQFGEVLAISFAQERDGRAPESVAGYIQALISTAINGSVTRSVGRLPRGAVLPLKSTLSLFDFAKAFAHPIEDQGAAVQLMTQDWISKRRRQSPQRPESAILEGVMVDIFQWYRRSQTRESRRSLKSVLTVTANCCRVGTVEDAEPDGIVKEYRFAPQHMPMTMFHVMVGETFVTSEVRIEVRAPDDQEVEHWRMPALDRRQDGVDPGDEFGYVLLFKDPLSPLTEDDIGDGKAYRVRVMYAQPGGLVGLLGPSRHDYITHRNNRSENYECVDVILRKPPNFHLRGHAEWSDDGGKGYAEQLVGKELEPYDSVDPGMISMGWCVRNFPTGRVLRIDLYKEG